MIYTDTRAIRRTTYGLRNGVPNIYHQGGTSSGKTFGNLYALLSYLLYDRQGDKLLCSVVSENYPHLRRGAYKDFVTILTETGLSEAVTEAKSTHTFTLPGGSQVEFFAADNEGKARGAKRDILFVNEGNNVAWDIYYQLALRTSETVIVDWNPSGEFWLHEHLLPTLGQHEYIFTRTTYRDNPAVTPKVVAEIERLKLIDPVLYRVYAEGKTGMVQGLVFPEITIVPEFPKDAKKLAYGLDFGFTNDPTTLVRMGVSGGGLYGEELLYETGLTNDDICKRLESLGLRKTDEIVADSAEPKSIEEIRRKGWNIRPAVKGADSVNFGIGLLKQYGLNLTAASTNWRKEARNYKWKEKDGRPMNAPIDAFNHCFDAARYYASKMLNTGGGGYRPVWR